MAEENVEIIQVETKVEDKNPFNENNWTETPVVEEKQVVAEAAKVEEKSEEEVFNEDDYIKNKWGFNTAEDARREIEELRALKGKQPEPLKFANEQSEKYFNALKDGKEDDVWNYLNEKKRLERIEKMDIKTVNEAAEIIKADLQYKYKDLTPEEIERQFARRFPTLKEPKQTDLQTDEEFAEVMNDYKQKLKDTQLDMIIEAKMARPEISKFKSELVLPDIPKTNGEPKLSQEELAAREADLKVFQEAFDRDYKNFSGYTIKAKDGDVELPVNYVISQEEQNVLKAEFNTFDLQDYFAKRWITVDKTTGRATPNVAQTLDDRYLLENRDKIFQKIANEAAAQMAAYLRKQKSNINVDGGGAKIMDIDKPKESREAEVAFLMKNG
jgi:hypothetical protein